MNDAYVNTCLSAVHLIANAIYIVIRSTPMRL